MKRLRTHLSTHATPDALMSSQQPKMSFEKPEWEELGGPEGLKLPEGEFTVYGTAYMHPELADKAFKVYQRLVTLAQDEPGTLSYHVSRDQDDPSVFHFFERFRDKAAFEEHNASQIVKDMFGECNKSVKAVFAKPIEGK